MKILFAALAALVLLTSVQPAHAYVITPTYDMAGDYDAPDIQATVVVRTNGTAAVVWDNEYGRFVANYVAFDRIPGGGFVAEVDNGSQYLPNNAGVIAIKPAERGFIQLFLFDQNTKQISGVYRMFKFRN